MAIAKLRTTHFNLPHTLKKQDAKVPHTKKASFLLALTHTLYTEASIAAYRSSTQLQPKITISAYPTPLLKIPEQHTSPRPQNKKEKKRLQILIILRTPGKIREHHLCLSYAPLLQYFWQWLSTLSPSKIPMKMLASVFMPKFHIIFLENGRTGPQTIVHVACFSPTFKKYKISLYLFTIFTK